MRPEAHFDDSFATAKSIDHAGRMTFAPFSFIRNKSIKRADIRSCCISAEIPAVRAMLNARKLIKSGEVTDGRSPFDALTPHALACLFCALASVSDKATATGVRSLLLADK